MLILRSSYTFLIALLFIVMIIGNVGAQASNSSGDDDVLIDELDEDLLKAKAVSPEKKDSLDISKKDTTAGIAPDTAKSAVKPAQASGVKAEKVKPADDELILDGEEEDILGNVKIVKIDTTGNKNGESTQASDAASKAADSSQLKEETIPIISTTPIVTAKKDDVPLKVDNIKSINFSKNLNEYRSPKLAMLLSLVLPGTGQVYAKKGWKAAIFGAIEVGIVSAGVYYSVKGLRASKDAYEFADQHYSIDAMKNYYSKFKKVYGDSVTNMIFEDDSILGITKSDEYFYDNISNRRSYYIRGWDDVIPELDDNLKMIDSISTYQSYNTDTSYLFIQGNDTNTIGFGFSNNQIIFNDKVSKSSGLFKISKNIFTMLLVNHLVSALDAGITAKAYNDRLLGKQSFWQRINLEEVAVNTGSSVATGYALQIRF
jgi:hypothetical protein